MSAKGLRPLAARSRVAVRNAKFMSKPIIAGRDAAVAGSAERTPSVWWALASLSLSMLLSSLGTIIANVGLPTLAQAFSASFQEVSGSCWRISSPSPP